MHAEGPWYVSGSVGGYFREDNNGPDTIHNQVITAPGTTARTFDPGVISNVAVGFKLPFHMRVELEAGYTDYQTAKVNPSSSAFGALNGQDFNHQSGGDRTRYMGTVNVFYDLPPIGWDWFVPYVGGGIGGTHGESTHGRFVDSNNTSFTGAGGQSVRGIALLEGGISISLTDHIAVVPAYRYVRFFADSPSFGDEIAHIAKLGLRYSF